MTDLSAEFKAYDSYRPINIMRRILQGMGVEVVHLGHNRSVRDVVQPMPAIGARKLPEDPFNHDATAAFYFA